MEAQKEILELTRELEHAGFLYYVKDAPEITDYDYDRKLRRLEELEAQVRVLNLCKIDEEIDRHVQAIADARRQNDQTAILLETQAILQLRQLKLQEEEAVSDRRKANQG